jgi:DNA-binding NarL/FixJ family response regulator
MILVTQTRRCSLIAKKHILLVDDHELVRKRIRSVVEERFAVCGEGSNGQEAVARTIELKPDLEILDVAMPVLNGIEAGRRIRRIASDTNILLLSEHECFTA